MRMPKLVSPFRRLQGKMTIFYMLNAVVAFLVVEIMLVGGAVLISVPNIPFFASAGSRDLLCTRPRVPVFNEDEERSLLTHEVS